MGPIAFLAASHVAAPTTPDGAARSDDSGAASASRREAHGISVVHSFYSELLGPFGLYSVNYDLAIGGIAFRVGGSYIPGFHHGDTGRFVPGGTISVIAVGSETKRLELGVGVAVLSDATSKCRDYSPGGCSSNDWVLAGPHVGARIQESDGGLFFHIGLTSFVGLPDASPIIPWPYIGLGVSL